MDTIIPPRIIEKYNRNLLSQPYPKFYDNSERLLRIFNYIERKLAPKIKNEQQQHNYNTLKQEFLNLYERTIAKEKEIEEKTGHPAKGFCYYFEGPHQNYKKLFERLRYRA